MIIPLERDFIVKVNFNSDNFNLLRDLLRNYVVLQMRNYFILIISKSELNELTEKGIQYNRVAEFNENYSYYLIRYFSEETLSKIKMKYDSIELEAGVAMIINKERKLPLLPREAMIRELPLSPAIISRIYQIKPYPSLKIRQKPEIQYILSLISKERYRDEVQKLQDFITRYYNTINCQRAADFIYNYFKDLSLEVEAQSFKTPGANSRNIIGIQKGESDPNSFIIIGAHYDSYSYDINYAPGADDNASGTAAVMEAATILSKYNFDFSIKYIAFAAEEIGLKGSNYYASEAKENGEKIIGVINLDMIAYTDYSPEDLDILSNPKSQWLGDIFLSNTEAYTNLKATHTINSSFQWSDHASFWHQNYSAITGIEDISISNPYYHTPSDKIETLNLTFATEATKAATANVIYLAQLYDNSLPEPPSSIQLSIILNKSFFDKRKHILLTWKKPEGTIAGYNIYKTDYSHHNYKKLNTFLITSTHYEDINLPFDSFNYYTLTSVSSEGNESHYSAEVSDDDYPFFNLSTSSLALLYSVYE